jgi:hypothetical protein
MLINKKIETESGAALSDERQASVFKKIVNTIIERKV